MALIFQVHKILQVVYNNNMINFLGADAMENTKIESLLIQILENQTSMKSNISTLSSKVDKNSLMLEKIQTDIKTLAEVQQSFSEQLDRTKDKDGKTLGERLDIIELAISNTSKSVNNVVNAIDVIKETTGSHEMDIKILKKIRNNHSF
jgi:septal ring factor EnvC (AmiA/AmiB activator)